MKTEAISAEQIIADWKKNTFKPVYWLEGDEPYFIDKVIKYAETKILNEAEAGFNLTVLYGKDSDWATVVNACRRYPMFAEKQVVILKEAQHLKDIDKLEAYVENPLNSTLFVVGYKEKKIDGRSKFSKAIKEKGVLFNSSKIYDNKVPDWTSQMVKSKGYTISQKALMLLVDHIGNDLSRIENEVEKVFVNMEGRTNITDDDIEQFVGISKEFNVFALQAAIAHKDMAKALRIIQYFDANPKAAPIQMLLPVLYGFFSKVYILFSVNNINEDVARKLVGANYFSAMDYVAAANNYQQSGIEFILLLLHSYNLKGVGVGDVGNTDGALMKELISKIILGA